VYRARTAAICDILILMPQIGKLETVPLRELWKHEERGFSVWLESNLDSLSQAIGVVLSDPQRESLAGNFQVDLVAASGMMPRLVHNDANIPITLGLTQL
jgi:hypothetical protein